MPPLDTGTTHTLRLVDPLNDRGEPVLSEHASVGAYLKAVREHRGRSLDDLVGATRVSKAYLAAIERGDYAVLPSRPFAVGYVRAFAEALGLDEEAMAARFKAEFPDTSPALQAPIGVQHNGPERRPLIAAVAAVIVIAVVGWNVVQRIVTMSDPAPAPAVPDVAAAPTPGTIALGGPTPPPADQTSPAPYITPGMNGIVGPSPIAPPPPPSADLAPVLDRAAPVVFTPKGQIYGVPAVGPTVVLNAIKPASLVVRGPTGAVHFAKQLVAGESYRAPIGQKLVSEVTDPAAFAVYINNQLQGLLSAPQTPLDQAVAKVVASMPAAPAPAAAAAPAPRRAPTPVQAPSPAATLPPPAPVATAPAEVAPPVAPPGGTAPLTGSALGSPRPTGAPPPAPVQPAPAPDRSLF